MLAKSTKAEKGPGSGLGRSSPVYLLAHFAKALMWHGGNLFFAFYLTEMCGQPPSAMAVLIATSSVLNALADAVAGKLLAASMTSGAIARRQQLAGGLVTSLAFALFCMAATQAGAARLMIATPALLAFRIAYAWLDVPQNALLAFLPAGPAQQERLVAARMIVGHLAQCVMALLLGGMILHWSASSARWFALGGATISVIVVATALLLRFAQGEEPGPRRLTAGALVTEPRDERDFCQLLFLCAAFAFASGLVIRLEAYLAAFGLGAGAAGVSVLPVALAGGALIAQPGWTWLSARGGVTFALRIAGAALAFAALLFGASPWLGETVVPVAAVLFGAALGGTGFALWAMLARTALQGSPARSFGVFTSVSKLAHALSALVLGAVLARGDYREAAGASILWAASPISALLVAALLLALVSRTRSVRTGNCA